MVGGRRTGLSEKAVCLSLATAVCVGLILGFAPLASASSACDTVAGRCAADPFCAGCTTAIAGRRKGRSRRRLQEQAGDDDAGDDDSVPQELEGPPALCSARYPTLLSGSTVTFCERVGIAHCCDFSDNDTAQACLADPLSAEYWGCFLTNEVQCDLSDMPCHASYRDTPSPTAAPVFVTSSPTAAPTAAPAAPTTAPTVVVAVTPSPTAGSRGGLDIPTPSPAMSDAEELDPDDIDLGDIEDMSSGTARAFGRHDAVLAGLVGVVTVATAQIPRLWC